MKIQRKRSRYWHQRGGELFLNANRWKHRSGSFEIQFIVGSTHDSTHIQHLHTDRLYVNTRRNLSNRYELSLEFVNG